MTALLEKVFAQARQLPAEEQDAVAERLLRTITQWTQEKNVPASKPHPQFGSARGLGFMTADFDEPLEDFKEYME